MPETRTTILNHDSEFGSWSILRHEPPPALRPYVTSYTGYVEQDRSFAQHLQTPSSKIPLIINLGSPYRISSPDDRGREIGSFAAGLHDGPALVGSDGPQHCLQADLTPLDARRIFNLPMHELSNRVVRLDDLLGEQIPLLIEQLHETPSWEERFALLNDLLITRLTHPSEVPSGIGFAWEQLLRSNGQTSIGGLASELGWSHRHLIAQFREYIGLPPKKLARILRFERAVRSIHGRDDICLASLARAAGYFDQAHLHRDFREFTGRTPAELLQRRLPDMDGLVGD